MVLKRIKTKNLQSHKEVVLDLPKTGLILLYGGNSNGKSVIVKMTRDLLQNNIKHPKCRAELINRSMTYGEIEYTREDDVVLTVHLTREAATTYIKLTYPNGQEILRYLADKNYLDLAREFGWNISSDTGISLNIAESDDALLFYKTHYKVNAKVLQSANTDPLAERALEQLEETLKTTRKFRDDAIASTRVISSALNQLVVHDVESLYSIKERLEYYKSTLSGIEFPVIPEIKAVPKIKFISYYKPEIPKIKLPKLMTYMERIPNIIPVARELKEVSNYICPTCKRRFVDES